MKKKLVMLLSVCLFFGWLGCVPQPKSAEDSFKEFLNVWLIEQDIDKAAKFFHKGEYLRDAAIAMSDDSENAGRKLNIDKWLKNTLVFWLTDGGDRLSFKNLESATSLIAVRKAPNPPGIYVAVVELKHTPHTTLIFRMKKIGVWKIDVFAWMAG